MWFLLLLSAFNDPSGDWQTADGHVLIISRIDGERWRTFWADNNGLKYEGLTTRCAGGYRDLSTWMEGTIPDAWIESTIECRPFSGRLTYAGRMYFAAAVFRGQ